MKREKLISAGLALTLLACAREPAESLLYNNTNDIVVDSVDDNVTMVNLDQSYLKIYNIAHKEVLSVLERDNLAHEQCNKEDDVSVEVVVTTHADLNKMRESGAWGQALAIAGNISGFFEWTKSDKGFYRMYLVRDGAVSFEELFVHEYVHAYFFANCVVKLNSLSLDQEEKYAEEIRKNYLKR